jgi:hypothetical protein
MLIVADQIKSSYLFQMQYGGRTKLEDVNKVYKKIFKSCSEGSAKYVHFHCLMNCGLND